MIRNYFLIAIRNLERNKIYSFINILGLSLGLACAMLILLYIKDEASYDRFHKEVNQVYRVSYKEIKADGSNGNLQGFTGYLQGPRFASRIPEIKHFVRYQENFRDLKSGSDIQAQRVFFTDSAFFEVFTFPLLAGDPATALHDPFSVVISEEMAHKHFGKDDALGKTLLFKDDNEFKPFIVKGVAKNCPQNSSIKFDVLMPMRVSSEDYANNENWFNFFLNTFVMLEDGADVKAVEAKMKAVYEQDAKATMEMIAEKYGMNDQMLYFLQPYTDMHLNKDLPPSNGLAGASNPMYSYILSGIAVFILLIACINFVNLTVARSVKRAKEIGVRKVVGGDRRQLIIQFLGESFILCLIAFLLAIFIAQLVLPVFNQLANKSLSISYLFDAKLVAGYVLLFLVTGILAGFYPALVLSNYNPVHTLYSKFTLGGRNYLQKLLVVVQFALASFLIIATLTIYSQFNYLTSKDLGYDDNNVVYVETRGLMADKANPLRNQLRQVPGVAGLTFKNGGSWGTIAKVNGETQIHFAYESVDEHYLPMLNIPVIKGRNFNPLLSSDSTRSVLVNESFVKQAEWKEALGQEVNFWYRDEKYTVVGVVKDHHYEGLQNKIGPQLFTMKPGNPYGKVMMKIKPNAIAAALPQIEKIFRSNFPMDPYVYRFVDKENLRYYEAESKWKQIMLFSAVLTIFISSIGLFGLTVLSTEKRTKEIGIRKVLGASVSQVTTILSRDFLKLVVVSLVVSFPLAWVAADKWLENYPYRISIHFGLFAGAAALVIAIALLTVSFQAFKAATANPVKSLKTE